MPRKPKLHPDLERLMAVVPPPDEVIELGTPAAWKQTEFELQLKLPNDYKQLIDHYGHGCFAEFLHLLSPFAANPLGNLLHRGKQILDGERKSGMAAQLGFPFPLSPDEAGVLPWAITDNGDRLCWYTHRAFNSWPVVVWSARSVGFEVYQRTACGFLSTWLAGQLSVGVFPAGPYPKSFVT